MFVWAGPREALRIDSERATFLGAISKFTPIRWAPDRRAHEPLKSKTWASVAGIEGDKTNHSAHETHFRVPWALWFGCARTPPSHPPFEASKCTPTARFEPKTSSKTPETHPKTSKSRLPLKKHEWKAANLIMKKKKLDQRGGILVEVSNGDGIPGSLYLLVVLMNHHQ